MNVASMQVQMYPQAATCYEEVLMHQPSSIASHVQVCMVHCAGSTAYASHTASLPTIRSAAPTVRGSEPLQRHALLLLHAATSNKVAMYAEQYADLLYTMGGPANYRAARSYYAAAVDLSQGENVRALYGLCATAAQLSTLREGSKVNISIWVMRNGTHALGCPFYIIYVQLPYTRMCIPSRGGRQAAQQRAGTWPAWRARRCSGGMRHKRQTNSRW